MTTAAEAAANQKLRFQARLADPKEVWGIPFNMGKLDKITGGIQLKEVFRGAKVGDNDLITLIADTGVGKSSIAGMIARNVARYFKDNCPGYEVRYATLEMSAEKLQDRMAASDAGIPLHRIKTGMFISEAQEQRYYSALTDLAALPISYITLEEAGDMRSLYNLIAKPREGMKCGFWVVDHLHICPGEGDQENSRLNGVIKYLDSLSKRHAPGLVLGQMNKDALRRQDKRPQKSDILYGSTLMQASSLVLGLYREDIYTQMDAEEAPNERPAELNILKSRDGAMACIYLTVYVDRMFWEVNEKRNGAP